MTLIFYFITIKHSIPKIYRSIKESYPQGFNINIKKGKEVSKMLKKQKTKTIFRDSETGRLVTKKYAEKHPKTTEKEKVKTEKE